MVETAAHLSNWQWWKIKDKEGKKIRPRFLGLPHTAIRVKIPVTFQEGNSVSNSEVLCPCNSTSEVYPNRIFRMGAKI